MFLRKFKSIPLVDFWKHLPTKQGHQNLTPINTVTIQLMHLFTDGYRKIEIPSRKRSLSWGRNERNPESLAETPQTPWQLR